DYDGDGDLDLYLVNGRFHPELSHARGRRLAGRLTNALYRNNGDGTFTDVTVEAGNAIAYPLRIRNNGEGASQLTMSVVSAPSNWDAKFTSDGVEISSFNIDAGESLNLKLEVEPPSIVETGDYAIVIRAESTDGKTSENIELMATVMGSYEVELELSTLYETTTIGQSVEFTVEVTNQGNSPLTSVYIETAIPADWEIAITPSQVSTIAPMASTTFTLVVETPSDTVAGDYLVMVQALSDRAESEEIDLRVTAQASTSWGFLGIGLAVVVVIGLGIMFTRFKRR
ncbi:VCBS repeat-containing protein, partial [Candidatus Calescamantes bacterium]|nr:VCBS repeat-containing protein [Candidatus Calescamantes bacterium]